VPRSGACPSGTLPGAGTGMPWGFELREVAAHVDLWHGTEDRNVPVAVAEHIADQLPDCEARFVEGGGHSVALSHLDDIVRRWLTPCRHDGRPCDECLE
jgi:predicted esterase